MQNTSVPNPVVDALILDLLEWLTLRPRTYEETLAAWRTSCPRLPVWEDANDRQLIAISDENIVRASAIGLALLRRGSEHRSS